jgi:hypothetical protein
MSDPIFDFPAGWQIFATTDPEQHHEECSYRVTDRALICDCAALHAAGAAWDLALEKARTPETYVAEERPCETCKENRVPELKPEFRFEMWAVSRPNDRYFHTNWDGKRKITVIATDQQAAFNLADAALGNAGPHRYWTFKVISITDHRIPVQEPS